MSPSPVAQYYSLRLLSITTALSVTLWYRIHAYASIACVSVPTMVARYHSLMLLSIITALNVTLW